MSMALTQRVKELETKLLDFEKRLKAQEEKPVPVVQSIAAAGVLGVESDEVIKQAGKKKLCPKCGKVPGYFYHVKSCKG